MDAAVDDENDDDYVQLWPILIYFVCIEGRRIYLLYETSRGFLTLLVFFLCMRTTSPRTFYHNTTKTAKYIHF